MGRVLVFRPSHGKRRQDEAVQLGIDAGRHRPLDHLNAPNGVIWQVLWNEYLAQAFDTEIDNRALARPAFQNFQPWQFLSGASFAHPVTFFTLRSKMIKLAAFHAREIGRAHV